MKRVLLIAFHYPPVKGSSGLQRTLRYSAYLQQYGWHPEVLTVHPMAYADTGDDELGDIPEHVAVHRAWALNTRKHLSLFGRYPGFLAKPDAWMSWQFDGVRTGRKLLKSGRFDAIWSTYPIVTAHRIAYTLASEFTIPWVADFRDLMACEDWPLDAQERDALLAFQSKVVARANRCVLTTPGATRHYAALHPDEPEKKFVCLPNGYDESSFRDVTAAKADKTNRIVLLHAGILYPSERDPRPFFEALASMKQQQKISHENFCVRLRATGHDAHYTPMLAQYGIQDLVELAPPLPYKQVLNEMIASTGLLIFQAANCNEQIPAKLYEYFRAGRPIVALTDAHGDTAATIREENAGVIAQIDDAREIEAALDRFIADAQNGALSVMPPDRVTHYSREHQAGDLARVLDSLCLAAST
ncbi:MAG: glycosyltransferase [Pseudomonadota bacterium]